MAYTEVTIASYNANPPADDGTTGSSNRTRWVQVKNKLFDPLLTAIETLDDNVFAAIAVAETDVTTLESSISSLETAVGGLTTALSAPNGTAMLFQQTSAPTGWTKGSSYNDYALRLVTGTASTGGSTAFSSIFTARTVATANLPSHTHTFSQSDVAITFDSAVSGGFFLYFVDRGNTSGGDASGGSSRVTDLDGNTDTITGTVSISGTTGSSGSGGTWDFAIQYVDFILATRG